MKREIKKTIRSVLHHEETFSRVANKVVHVRPRNWTNNQAAWAI